MPHSSLVRAILVVTEIVAPLLLISLIADHSQTTTPRPDLIVDPIDLDLGEIWAQSDFQHSLSVRNDSRRSIEVIDVLTTCECMTVTPPQVVIRPGESQKLHLRLDLLRGAPSSKPSVPRSFTASVSPVTSNSGSATTTWKLHATVLDPMSYVPATVYLGDRFPGAAFEPIVLALEAHARIRSLEATASDKRLRVSITQVPSKVQQFELSIEPVGPFDLGTFEIPITITPIHATKQRLPSIATRAVGTTKSPLVVLPNYVHLGAIRLGDSATAYATVSSLDGGPVSIASAKCEGLPFTIEVMPAEADAGARIRVTGSPRAAGTYNSVITVDVEIASPPMTSRVQIPVTCYCSANDGL